MPTNAAVKAPAPSSLPTSLNQGLSGLLRAVTSAERADTAERAARDKQADALTKQAEAGIDKANALSTKYAKLQDDQLSEIHQLVQGQRALTLTRASALRKFMPIALAFAALGGALAGTVGALSGFAGALAGATKGEQERYKRSQQQFMNHVNGLLAANKASLDSADAILKNVNLGVEQKIQLINTLHSNLGRLSEGDISAAFSAIGRAREQQAKMQAAADKFNHATKTMSTSIADAISADVSNHFGFPKAPPRPGMHPKPPVADNTAEKEKQDPIYQQQLAAYNREVSDYDNYLKSQGFIQIAAHSAQSFVNRYMNAHPGMDERTALNQGMPLFWSQYQSFTPTQRDDFERMVEMVKQGKMTKSQAMVLAQRYGLPASSVTALSGLPPG